MRCNINHLFSMNAIIMLKWILSRLSSFYLKSSVSLENILNQMYDKRISFKNNSICYYRKDKVS